MRIFEKGEHDLFLLAVLLIVAVYFIGLSTEGVVLFQGLNNLGLTFTGRTSQGKFAAYPATGGIGDTADAGALGDDAGASGFPNDWIGAPGDDSAAGAAQYDAATAQLYAWPVSWRTAAASVAA